MELSSKLLSQANDPAQVARLCRLLAQIRVDLNLKQMCMLQGECKPRVLMPVRLLKINQFSRMLTT